MRLHLILLALTASTSILAQQWTSLSLKAVPARLIEEMPITPSQFDTYRVDDDAIRQQLWTAPMRGGTARGLTISLPTPSGVELFEVFEYELFEEELAARHPDIKAFHGRSLKNPMVRVAVDYTAFGVRAVISNHADGQIYIDHLSRGDKSLRIVYTRADYASSETWSCGTVSKHQPTDNKSMQVAGDCQFRRYRLAMATTGEYSNYWGATSSSQSGLVLSGVTTTVNRVNEVYRQDLNLEMQLVNNTDQIFYYNPATDPFTNNNEINENQPVCDNNIGSANYDIGHVVDTGDGGVARIRSVCRNGIKARGYTGRNVPEGDPFDIDYVAHEIGHQFGANHTQNNSCNRVNSAAMEPGSASTIMGYAGICSPNVQNNSDAYFHAVSLEEMTAEIATTSCATILSNPNSEPTISTLSNYTIPAGTPFILDAVVTDVDGDPLLYCWEQYDNEITANKEPVSTWTQGPVFRSYAPVDTSIRPFPRYVDLAAAVDGDWEEIPTVSRNMDFRLTVRDVPLLGGCTDEQNLTVTTNTAAGPFDVTSPTASTVNAGDIINVAWSVAGTDVAPINCTNVDIYWQQGSDPAQLLLGSTPNDGSASITVPSVVTSVGKILVKCSTGIFYDVNPGYLQVLPENLVCNTYNPSDLPITISNQGTPTITSQINVGTPGQIFDINLLDLEVAHTFTGDLEISLISPSNGSVVVVDRVCGSNNNIDLSLDGAASSSIPCPANDGGTYLPDNPLTAFSDIDQLGTWSLQIRDLADVDGGSFTNYTLEICTVPEGCDLVVTNTTTTGAGSLLDAVACAESGDTIIIDNTVTGNIYLPTPLVISKDVTIRNLSPTVSIYTDVDELFLIPAGRYLNLEMVNIECENENGPCVINDGSLRLEDVRIENTLYNGHVTNQGVGTMEVVGTNAFD